MDTGFPLSVYTCSLAINLILTNFVNDVVSIGNRKFKKIRGGLKTTLKSAKRHCREAGVELFDEKTSRDKTRPACPYQVQVNQRRHCFALFVCLCSMVLECHYRSS
jgi:hypothetical protein